MYETTDLDCALPQRPIKSIGFQSCENTCPERPLFPPKRFKPDRVKSPTTKSFRFIRNSVNLRQLTGIRDDALYVRLVGGN